MLILLFTFTLAGLLTYFLLSSNVKASQHGLPGYCIKNGVSTCGKAIPSDDGCYCDVDSLKTYGDYCRGNEPEGSKNYISQTCPDVYQQATGAGAGTTKPTGCDYTNTYYGNDGYCDDEPSKCKSQYVKEGYLPQCKECSIVHTNPEFVKWQKEYCKSTESAGASIGVPPSTTSTPLGGSTCPQGTDGECSGYPCQVCCAGTPNHCSQYGYNCAGNPIPSCVTSTPIQPTGIICTKDKCDKSFSIGSGKTCYCDTACVGYGDCCNYYVPNAPYFDYQIVCGLTVATTPSPSLEKTYTTYYDCIPGGFCEITKSGVQVAEGQAACDPLKLNKKFSIIGDSTGREYKCTDTGSAVVGDHVVVFFKYGYPQYAPAGILDGQTWLGTLHKYYQDNYPELANLGTYAYVEWK